MNYLIHIIFQGYSCWNGAALLNANPFYKHGIKFRRSHPGECASSECQLIAKDFWEAGYGNQEISVIILY